MSVGGEGWWKQASRMNKTSRGTTTHKIYTEVTCAIYGWAINQFSLYLICVVFFVNNDIVQF